MSKNASAPSETLTFDDPSLANLLFGPQNAHLAQLSARTGAQLSSCGATLSVSCRDAALREHLLNLFTQFYGVVRAGQMVEYRDLEQGLQLLAGDESVNRYLEGTLSLTELLTAWESEAAEFANQTKELRIYE